MQEMLLIAILIFVVLIPYFVGVALVAQRNRSSDEVFEKLLSSYPIDGQPAHAGFLRPLTFVMNSRDTTKNPYILGIEFLIDEWFLLDSLWSRRPSVVWFVKDQASRYYFFNGYFDKDQPKVALRSISQERMKWLLKKHPAVYAREFGANT